MEVRKGYKQSEIGVIPVDWDVVPMGSLGTFSKGMGIKKDEAKSGEIPCVRYGEIYTHHNDIVREFNSWISPEVAKTSRRLKKGEVLFAGSGETKEEIGKCVAFISDVEAYAGGDVVILTPNKGVSKFFGYLFNAPIIAKQKASKGQGDAIVHISATALSSIRIPLPPTLAEQEAIAEALSDADALIESLETLLAKKRQVKQGAMSELLTGKRRVVESPTGRLRTGEWEVKTLEQLIDCLDNLRVPLNETQRMKMQGDYPYCGANGVLGYVDSYVIDDDFILIAEDGGYFDEYATRPIAYKMSGKCWVNNHAHILKAKDNINQDFIYYSLVHKNILSFLASGTRAKLNKSEMYKIEIDIPSKQEEQTAIAEILSDMDAEIRAVEGKLSKARAVKAGMMSELLTGRVRLV